MPKKRAGGTTKRWLYCNTAGSPGNNRQTRFSGTVAHIELVAITTTSKIEEELVACRQFRQRLWMGLTIEVYAAEPQELVAIFSRLFAIASSNISSDIK